MAVDGFSQQLQHIPCEAITSTKVLLFTTDRLRLLYEVSDKFVALK